MTPESTNSRPDPDPPTWRQVFDGCENGLRAFLRGRLGQEADVEDCIQVVWIKMLEKGEQVSPAARRAWLFRVAANESARMWRRKATTDRIMEKQASNVDEVVRSDASGKIIQDEMTETLRAAIRELSQQSQEIIRLRIHENLTFQQIADQLEIPLGTALTTMRRAMSKLKLIIEPNEL